MATVSKAEIEKAIQKIVNLSRDLQVAIVTVSLSPRGTIDLVWGLGGVLVYDGDSYSDSVERVIFGLYIDPSEGEIPESAIRDFLTETLMKKGHTIV